MNTQDLKLNEPSAKVGQVLDYAQHHRKKFVGELIEFLRIPSIGTLSERFEDTERAADWLAGRMREINLENVSVIRTKRNPIVFGEWSSSKPDAKTILVYGHYDVQPADPLEEWDSPPFEPSIRDEYIYARGVSDDKGQLFIHLKCIESYLKSLGELPVNVKILIEGEEESGGQSLDDFVPKNIDLLRADVAVISDTHIISKDLPSIVYSLRGVSYVYLDVIGPEMDLHSGSYGGAVDNPINVLCHIIAKLKNEAGLIQIPGFYDLVRPLDGKEKKMLADWTMDEQTLRHETGVPALGGETNYTLAERMGARPTLDVNGIYGGYTGDGSKTVLPSSAHAKISMRLVPDQDSYATYELLRNYLEKISPPSVKVKCTYAHGSSANIVNYEIPAMQAALNAYEQVFDAKPVLVREGGSIPVVSLFKEVLGIETILMGFGLPDDRIHAPNERFYLPNFYKGIETMIHFVDIFSRIS